MQCGWGIQPPVLLLQLRRPPTRQRMLHLSTNSQTWSQTMVTRCTVVNLCQMLSASVAEWRLASPTLPCSAACRASCLAGDSAFAGFPAKRLSRVHGDAGAAGSCASNGIQVHALASSHLPCIGNAAVQGSGNAAAAGPCKWQDCWILHAWLRNLFFT